MSDRERILQAVRENLPSLVPDPERKHFGGKAGNSLSGRFATEAEKAGSTVRFLQHRRDVAGLLPPHTETLLWSNIPGLDLPGNICRAGSGPPPDKPGLVLMEGSLGVAENAAIWITADPPVYRALPFIASHLILLLPKAGLVETMHDAYRQLQGQRYAFGTFIAAPSKTADIEQHLVLGAHGPLTLTVCLTEE